MDNTNEKACCGCDCGACDIRKKDECGGCNAVSGRAPWTKEAGFPCCPFFACCREDKGFRDCGSCPELPCELFSDCVDPEAGSEENERWLAERLRALGR